MNFASGFFERAVEVSAHVVLAKDGFGRASYVIGKAGIGEGLGALLEKGKQEFQQRVSTEMRHTNSTDAIQSCKDIVLFSKTLLGGNVPDKLKIAMFSEWNIMGFMFDRNRKSYVACLEALGQLLDAVEAYKRTLSPADLEIWNNSTYGGAEQVPFFRGYLRGVMARVEV